MKIRVLVVDDEALARERACQLLKADSEIEVIGQCGDGQTAVEKIHKDKPDLVLLDVQMPELDGFAVVEAVGADQMPPVIFVTAHEKFALKAFDVHAIDYLLKPYDRERFETALRRAKDQLARSKSGDLQSKMSALLGEIKTQPKPANRLVIKTEGRVLLLKNEDVDWVEAADNYIILHVGADTHMLRETMTSIESRLPAEKFIRVNRSTIVNIDRIKELQ
ncbi:MAG TPA: LytTR family DNA-binding domain-containing protein, partial [Verrucomicrobiae bacterium]